jgi:hypothetical protein
MKEYLTITTNTKSLQEVLNDASSQGWEYRDSLYTPSHVTVIMEREKHVANNHVVGEYNGG